MCRSSNYHKSYETELSSHALPPTLIPASFYKIGLYVNFLTLTYFTFVFVTPKFGVKVRRVGVPICHCDPKVRGHSDKSEGSRPKKISALCAEFFGPLTF